MNKILLAFGLLVLVPVFGYLFYESQFALRDDIYNGGLNNNQNDDMIACTADARICLDGTAVGRMGPKCEFPKCPYEDQIMIENPIATSPIESPLKIIGKARGNWFFEGSFPITLKDDKGNVLAEGAAMAKGDWMTTDFVDFELELKFSTPKSVDGYGSLVFAKDNPSGMPKNDDQLVMPIGFVTYE